MVADALKALLSQSGLREAMEVLVVDNGSTDNTAEIVRQFPVTLLRETRPGVSAARNAGLRAARGEIIACLDADTLPTRRWLAELVRPFDDPAVTLVGGGILTYNPQSAAERYLDASGIYSTKHNVEAKVFPFAVGMNMAVRAAVAREIRGWEESLRWGEDIDFSQRILRRYPNSLAYAERAVLFHRNRTTKKALANQAVGYGRGAAMVYCRFPDIARWRIFSSMFVMGCVAGRWMNAALARIACPLGLMERQRAELTVCHALWSWFFWRGFLAEYYWFRTQKRF